MFVEFHPIVWMFSYDFKRVEFDYMESDAIVEELEGTYTDNDAPIKGKSVCWNHGLSTVIDSMMKAGLTLTDFKEYNYSPYNCLENLVEVEKGKYKIKGLENKFPLVYSVKAVKS
ncbi:hypothetical protein [Draconibacterium mangrovi]|uniref:hypothetical protein n=1 Tax=Draconibacterium mangrovi TaxID=2697469 RepID=UPI0019548ED2|nr:hypothetical protein [Draconibacterium mangrovi]